MLSSAELNGLLIEMLTGHAGGAPEQWRDAVGDIVVLSLETHPHCNWTVLPTGSAREIAAVDLAVELVRGDHPLARP
jgi:hypothetical protein